MIVEAPQDPPSTLGKQLGEIEERLRSSGSPYTILRSHSFMQITLAATRNVAPEDRIYMSFGEGKLGMVDARDMVEMAAKGAMIIYGKGFEHAF